MWLNEKNNDNNINNNNNKTEKAVQEKLFSTRTIM